MMIRCLLLLWCAALSGGSYGQDQHLPFPVDLSQAHALSLQQPGAVVILFSIPDCTYCEQVRAQSLRHLEKDPAYRGHVRVFELDFTDDRRRVVWFDGQQRTGKAVAQRLDVKFSPTVWVFTPTGGTPAKPLQGAGLPDFYNQYLDELIQQVFRSQ
ncbi:hypothetical protein NQT62_05115 [Limnobacter humi]|uniref:Thioredoxin-like fold domain-containing protein n=1 Tax=Limnobacter humi TaxID=1778671 RepID=A0ABT1WE69_9BURK|nr:hypothetical protein [Limnobacter humi]MCQ8895818.1 hypothetical protein [Limnobacter humi]